MMIDIWNHVVGPSYMEQFRAQGSRGLAPFAISQKALWDIDTRLRSIEAYEGYRQVLAPLPGPHVFPGVSGQAAVDLVRRNNEEMAEIVRRHPDQFPGWIAATPLADPEAAAAEAARAVRELGALGVQLEEDAVNLPLHEPRYEPLFAAMADLDAGVWLHPFRTPATPGTPPETAPFLLWQAFGWVFDTTITISRLIFAGIYDRHPGLKLIAHHGGGLIPHFSGRIGMISTMTAADPTLKETLDTLRRPLLDYLRMLYVDTAMFGAPHALRSVVDFFGPDHVLFGTDFPMDSQSGAHFIPATISDVEHAAPDETARSAIFSGNAQRLLLTRTTTPIG